MKVIWTKCQFLGPTGPKTQFSLILIDDSPKCYDIPIREELMDMINLQSANTFVSLAIQ